MLVQNQQWAVGNRGMLSGLAAFICSISSWSQCEKCGFVTQSHVPSPLSLPAACTSFVCCVQVTTATEHLKLWLQQKWRKKMKLTLRSRKNEWKIIYRESFGLHRILVPQIQKKNLRKMLWDCNGCSVLTAVLCSAVQLIVSARSLSVWSADSLGLPEIASCT